MEANNKKLSVVFFLKETAKSKKGSKRRVYCRITYNRLSCTIALDFEFKKSEWDENKGLPKKDQNSIDDLEAIENEFKNIKRQMIFEKQHISARKIMNIFLGKEMTNGQISDLLVVKALIQYNKYVNEDKYKAATTKKNINNMVKKFNLFLQNTNQTKIRLKEIDKVFLSKYNKFLESIISNQTKKPLKKSYIKDLNDDLKTFFNWCLSHDYLKQNPYRFYKIKIDESEKTIKFLTEEELEIVMNKKLNNSRLERVKDMFLFSCFTGIRHCDAISLKVKEIQKTDNGYIIYSKKQVKTKHPVTIPLLAPAEKIYLKYKDTTEAEITGLLFNGLSNQKANAYLKEIATLCNIDKNLTYHMSRHTCGTFLISNDVPIEKVAEILGHKNLKTTRIYAKLTGKSLEESMNKLNKKFRNKWK